MNFIMPEEDIFNPHKDRRFPLPIFYWLAKKTRFSGMKGSDKYEFFYTSLLHHFRFWWDRRVINTTTPISANKKEGETYEKTRWWDTPCSHRYFNRLISLTTLI